MGPQTLWGVVIGFLAGVFLRSLVPLGLSFAGFLLLLGGATVFLSYANAPRRAALFVAAAALCAAAAGVFRMNFALLPPDPSLSAQLGEEVSLEGVVFDEPDVRERSVRIPLRLESGAGILVIAPAHTAIAYGDRVRAEGILRSPEAFETGIGRQFNYPAYLAKDGISYELAFANVEMTGEGSRNPLKVASIYIKQKFLEGLSLVLPEPAAGLAGGITAGDKRGLGTELSDVFRSVGLTHIVVLSGYNIMIVVVGLGWLLRKMRAPRAWKVLFGIGIALLFALITGLASASLRAAAMASLALIGEYSGRVYLAARALALVAAAMVVWNPYILAFDPGFQLSVLATAGLIVFTPRIAPRLKWVTTKLNLREIFATTLAAQLAVLPLLLYQTGALPLYALPANLFTLVAVPWAMLFSALASLGGLFLGSFGVVLAFPAHVLLSYIIEIGNFFSSLPFASLALPAFSAWWLVPIYAFLFWLVYRQKSEPPGQTAAAQGGD